jgi:acyl-CoA hydrolase
MQKQPDSKTPASSALIHHAYKVFPNDLNSNGTVFGGLVMSICDRLTLIVAERHSEKICVTASVDALHFLAPAKMGDVLLFSASVNRSWSTSMEVGVRVDAENSRFHQKRHIVSAYFTYVALDEHNRPSSVPAVNAETALEKRRFQEAGRRRELRLAEAKLKEDTRKI